MLRIENWGLAADESGALIVGGARAEDLARTYGTPLHVIDEAALRTRVRRFRDAFEAAYHGRVSVHYALKCNSTPGIVERIVSEGIRLEAGTLFEWTLARRLGVPPGGIVVNGPHKGPLLDAALGTDPAGWTGAAGRDEAPLVVADGPADLDAIETAAMWSGHVARVLLRVNPNAVPKGMNRASATGSRKHSVFGFDPASGEIAPALDRLARSRAIRFEGFHCHAGTGIRRRDDYDRPIAVLLDAAVEAARRGHETRALDVGGGFGVPTSREMDTIQFLLYQGAGRLPKPPDPRRCPPIEAFAAAVCAAVENGCAVRGLPLPALLLEPGRSLVSGAGVLLLTVGSIKHRRGVRSWAIADGGAGTVAFPLFYEYHEIFLCRAPAAPRGHTYALVGPACFSADWICRCKRMPELRPGDVLAVCDAGAYFTVQESNFGFPRPAIIAVSGGNARVLRRRETFEDMVSRDAGWEDGRA